MFPPARYTGKDGRIITVKLATPEHYDEGIATWESVTKEKVYLLTETLRPNTKDIWKERWANNGNEVMFALAEIGGEIAGGSVLTMYSIASKTEHVRELGMWIIKEHRSNGLGNALMDYTLQWAQNNGKIKKILLGVWSTNTNAMNLYLKSGFHIEGSHIKIAKINNSYVDEVLMSLDL